ncbi:MAG: photosynthetic complex assembly protein PuhC [Betaproteobacteria bacterium]|jgi:putative photosynthetic complex assembly protein|nr:photosynthetic complex assembly protein PuhC [Betaproteobacteria bacterium]
MRRAGTLRARLAARYPLLRVLPGWLMVAVLALPAGGFWLGLQLQGGRAPAMTPSVVQRPSLPRMVSQRHLRFVDAPDKSVRVIDADSGLEVHRVTGEAGFVRGILRGMARERRRLGKGAEEPFELTLDAGMLSLRDLATGERIELTAFGHTNANAFAVMLQVSGQRLIQAEVTP